MLKQCLTIFHCTFEHDGETSCCTAVILESSPARTVFKFSSNVLANTNTSVVYVLNTYNSSAWLVNLTDTAFASIDNPHQLDSTIDDLLEMDDMDEYTAEELATVIDKASSLYEADMILDALDNTGPTIPAEIKITDEDLPF